MGAEKILQIVKFPRNSATILRNNFNIKVRNRY